MKKKYNMTYLMEAPMYAFPRYSAILLALAFSIPAAFAQEVEDIDIAAEEETPVVETAEAPAEAEAAADGAEAQPEVELTETEKELLREQTSASIEELIARQAMQRNADELQKKANSAFQHEDYDVAVDTYVDVLKLLEEDVVNGEVPEANKRKIAEVKNMISQSYYFWAQKIFGEAEKTAQIGLYDEAIEKCEEAIKVYDGQTVVIGGILSDTHGALSDRWPIFADIPLIGRLFTESASESHKDNLIISVSTRLISGDGIPVRTNTQNGLPDFRR